MTAATAGRDTVKYESDLVSHPVAASTSLYNGCMVSINSSGYAVNTTDTAGEKFVGIATEDVDNSSGSNGDLRVKVDRIGVFELVSSGLSQSDEGADLYAADNQTVQTAATNIYVGKLAWYSSATVAPVLIDVATAAEPSSDDDMAEYGVAASTTITVGEMVCLNSSGYLVTAADTAGYEFVGIATETVDNSAGSNGDLNCLVKRSGVHQLTGSGLAVTDQKKPVWASDGTTVSTTPGNVFVGILSKYSAATVAHVDINPATKDPGVLKRGSFACFSLHHSGTVGDSALKMIEDMELPFAFRLRRMYASCLTAPGGSYVCTITFTDGSNTETVTITGSATKGESESLSQEYAANTDFDVTIVDDNASAATADVNVVIEYEIL